MNGAEVIAGRFAIVRPLARGNMGQVCEALDELTGEKVAVKTMLRRRNGELVSLREADKNAAPVPARGADHVAVVTVTTCRGSSMAALTATSPIWRWNTCRA